MILYMNVKITDTPHPDGWNRNWYNRGILPNSSKVDILLYQLYSYSVIPFDKTILRIKLGTNYQDQQERVNNLVYTIFKNHDLDYRESRNSTIRQNLDDINKFPDNELVFYSGSHDHPFISENLEWLNDVKEFLDVASENSVVAYTHYPETFFKLPRETPHQDQTTKSNKFSNPTAAVFWIDPTVVVKASYFKQHWNKHSNFIDTFCPRTTDPPINYALDIKDYGYYKEICRHFDAYGHVEIGPEHCPALAIPPNFFTDFKISYCEPKEGYTLIDPELPNVIFDTNGTWWDKTIDEIPLFWRKFAKEIKIADNINHDAKRLARNKNIRNLGSMFVDEKELVKLDI